MRRYGCSAKRIIQSTATTCYLPYLQYPNYAQRPQEDFLKPYFELYLAGRQIAFERGEVVVFMH